MDDKSEKFRSPSEEKAPVEEGQVLTPDLLRDVANKRTSIVSKEGGIVNASGHRVGTIHE